MILLNLQFPSLPKLPLTQTTAAATACLCNQSTAADSGLNLEPKLEYFLKEMNGDLKDIRRFPQYFSYSLEKKITPRHQLLMEHAVVMSLPEMLKLSDPQFNVQLIEKRIQLVEDLGSTIV